MLVGLPPMQFRASLAGFSYARGLGYPIKYRHNIYTYTLDGSPNLLEASVGEFVICEDLSCPKSFELKFQILYVGSENGGVY